MEAWVEPASVAVVVVALLVTAAGFFVVFAAAAAVVAVGWFLRRSPRKTEAPAALEAVVEVEETAAFTLPSRTDSPEAGPVAAPPSGADAAEPGPSPLSADFADFEDVGDFDTEDVAPTVRLRRPTAGQPAESASVDEGTRPPPLSIHWTDDGGPDEAIPTELFQVGLQSGNQDAIEADATEVFDAHQHEAFVVDDVSEGPRRS